MDRTIFVRAQKGLKRKISKTGLIIGRLLDHQNPPLVPHFHEPRTGSSHYKTVCSLRGYGMNETCIILGTAPSVASLDLSLCKNHFVLALNKSYSLTDRMKRNPDAVIISNPFAMQDYGRDALTSAKRFAFISGAAAPFVPPVDTPLYAFDQWLCPQMDDGYFQFEATKPLYHSGSVAHAALQLAVWMNFKRIIFAGVDFNYTLENPHFYNTGTAELYRVATTSLINQQRMIKGMQVAKRLIESRTNIELVNSGDPAGNNPFRYLPWHKATST